MKRFRFFWAYVIVLCLFVGAGYLYVTDNERKFEGKIKQYYLDKGIEVSSIEFNKNNLSYKVTTSNGGVYWVTNVNKEIVEVNENGKILLN